MAERGFSYHGQYEDWNIANNSEEEGGLQYLGEELPQIEDNTPFQEWSEETIEAAMMLEEKRAREEFAEQYGDRLADCELITFVSNSAGRGRKRSRPREVQLIRIGKRYWQINDVARKGIDMYVVELLPELKELGENEFHYFMEELHRRARIIRERKSKDNGIPF